LYKNEPLNIQNETKISATVDSSKLKNMLSNLKNKTT